MTTFNNVDEMGFQARKLMSKITTEPLSIQLDNEVKQFVDTAHNTEDWYRNTAIGLSLYLQELLNLKKNESDDETRTIVIMQLESL